MYFEVTVLGKGQLEKVLVRADSLRLAIATALADVRSTMGEGAWYVVDIREEPAVDAWSPPGHTLPGAEYWGGLVLSPQSTRRQSGRTSAARSRSGADGHP